jgi:polyhydroxyalkanoate synthase
MIAQQQVFHLPEMQLFEETLTAEVKSLRGLLTAEIKVLEGVLATSRQPSPFKPKDVRLPGVNELVENFAKLSEYSQHLFQLFIRKQMAGEMPLQLPDAVLLAKAFLNLFPRLLADPIQLIQAQCSFWQDSLNLWQFASRRLLGEQIDPFLQPAPGDKRFRDTLWAENMLFDWIKQSYLLLVRYLYQLFTSVEGVDAKTTEKISFYTRQLVDALSPTNFALTNPQVIQTTLETGGMNLIKGWINLLEDLDRGQGRLCLTQTDPEAFELGKNLAVTPGKVIYQTELMQLLQYQPMTEQVYQRPLLIIPPWINKYYILDLQPQNSFIHWAVEQGFTVFVISWVNPDAQLAEIDFQHYLSRGTLAALEAITQATGENEVNALGYCIGGTLLFCTLAYLAATHDDRLHSATALTTLIDFAQVGELAVFIDAEQLAQLDKQMAQKGYLDGYHMARVFNLLRANDLIWSFVIRRYLLGEDPFPFDLLYWNADSTRLPKAMHTFYLHQMYLHNKLKEPGGVALLDVPLDLGQIKTPVYFLSTKEDHIAPWQSVYAGTRLPGGPVTFVLGESGHIAGVINPPAAKKYRYWTQADLPATPEAWLAAATPHDGSWWLHWLEWLKPHAGPQVPARVPGTGKLLPLEEAPGSYVKVLGID